MTTNTSLVILCALVIVGSIVVAVVTQEPQALWGMVVIIPIISNWPEIRS